MADKTTEPYGLAPAFEKALVTGLCCRPAFWKRIGVEIDPSLLSLAPAKLALEAAREISLDLGRGPDAVLVVVQRLKRWQYEGKVDEDQIWGVMGMFDEAEDAGLPNDDSLTGEIAPILRRRLHREAVTASMDEFAKRGDFSRVRKVLEQAERVGVQDSGVGIKIGSSSYSEIEAIRHLERLPIGISELDSLLGGGLVRGESGVVIADSGGGKSMFLSHLTASAVSSGVPAAYATLELAPSLVLARLKSNWTDVPIDRLFNGSMEVSRERLGSLKLAPCYVREFAAGATTVDDLRQWLADISQQEGVEIKLLVVDYADRMSGGKDAKGHEIGKVVSTGLQAIAREQGGWVWTASQTQGRTEEKKIDLRHVAESMHKIRIPGLVVTLTPKDEGCSIQYFVAKHRFGVSRQLVGPLPHEFAMGRMVAPATAPQWAPF